MNEADTRDAESVCDVDGCNAWRQGEHNYCYHHKGLEKGPESDNGAPEGNQNATTHGLYALPENLKEHFTQTQEDRYTAYFEALCTRYSRIHGQDPDEFAKDRLSRIAIECVKERIADEWLAEQAGDTGNLLIESFVLDVDEQGNPVEVEQENTVLKELTALKRETRLTLKDMGLLHSPEDKQAQATEDLASLWANELRD